MSGEIINDCEETERSAQISEENIETSEENVKTSEEKKETSDEDTKTSEKNIEKEQVPKKRKNLALITSILICLVAAIGIIVDCFVRHGTDTFVIIALGIVGLIFGTLVDRLCLVPEEWHNWRSRYKSRTQMFKACFSGISWLAVFCVLFVVVAGIVIASLNDATFEAHYIVYVLSGIGVGPLVMRLLNLDTQSEVHISTIIEKKETYVGNPLAWSYYFNYLTEALTKFSKIQRNDTQKMKLDVNKLILLVLHYCYDEDDLHALDNKVTQLVVTTHEGYIFPVYSLETQNKGKFNYVICCIKEPLQTIEKMSLDTRCGSVKLNEREYQVKMFSIALDDLLIKRPNDKYRDKCILVPIMVKDRNTLKNGGLVELIMHKVGEVEESREYQDLVFLKRKKNTAIEPKQSKTSVSDKTCVDPGVDLVDMPNKLSTSTETSSECAEVKAQADSCSISINENGKDASVDAEKSNLDFSEKAPKKSQLQRQFKFNPSEIQPMLPNEKDKVSVQVDIHNNVNKKRRNNFGEHTEEDGNELATSDSRPTSDHSGENESQLTSDHSGANESQPTNDSVNEGENCSRKEEYAKEPAVSPPTFDHSGENKNLPTSSAPSSDYNGENEGQPTSSNSVNEEKNCLRKEEDYNGQAVSPPTSDHSGENENQPSSSDSVKEGGNCPSGGRNDAEPVSPVGL